MSIVDLAKARAYAEVLDDEPDGGTAADWIITLSDEVESLEHAVESARRSEQAALADAATLQAERDAAVAGLQELHRSIVDMLREARHIADNHPDPAAAGAAMKILSERTSK
jgi:hypothetical protein